MESEAVVHVLMVSFPGQGHVNPLLRLAKRLASKGLSITFSTTDYLGHMMKNATNLSNETTPVGEGHLRFEFFSDGFALDEPKRNDLDAMMQQLETVGKESLTQLINKQAQEGRPVSCLINNPFVPWASDIAADLGIPCAVLWVQSCAVFSAYYHYLHSFASFSTIDQPHLPVDLPGLPTLSSDEVPSFLHPSSPHVALRNTILGQFKNLSKSFCVLMESFDELEKETIKTMSRLSPLRPIGPLFKSPKGASTSSVRGHIWKAAEDCVEWLGSQQPASVVYVSFGSVVMLEKEQRDEMAWGLLNTGLPFLWVLRPAIEGIEEGQKLPDGFLEEVQGKGMVVQWCPQEQVLAHPSIACFVTHCGWNSSIESLSSGVPVVAFPQWGDQVTNAKFLVDVYGVGVRMGRGVKDGKLVPREEVTRCILEVARGLKAEEIKKNARKWKDAAKKAVENGGSSDRNIQAFVDDIRRMTFKSTAQGPQVRDKRDTLHTTDTKGLGPC